MEYFVGIPFRDGGRGPDAVDCWGLVVLVYRSCLGITLPTYGEISANDLRRVSRAVDAGKDGETWCPVGNPRRFDVAVMRLPASSRIGHVGIYAGGGMILHTEIASSTALEDVRSATIKDRIIGYWRHRSL